ncbi:hypothetical protein HY837_03175 [archaeon]|nr:hypothetical protein [archaeon]
MLDNSTWTDHPYGDLLGLMSGRKTEVVKPRTDHPEEGTTPPKRKHNPE